MLLGELLMNSERMFPFVVLQYLNKVNSKRHGNVREDGLPFVYVSAVCDQLRSINENSPAYIAAFPLPNAPELPPSDPVSPDLPPLPDIARLPPSSLPLL